MDLSIYRIGCVVIHSRGRINANISGYYKVDKELTVFLHLRPVEKSSFFVFAKELFYTAHRPAHENSSVAAPR